MMANPKAVTNSAYTTDPADGIAAAVEAASYQTFTQDGIAQTVNALNKGITVSADDVSVSGDSASVTFLYGYTKKSVSISKQ